MSRPTIIETRTYRYESAEYGTIFGAPRSIKVRISYSHGGYSVSFQHNGQRFQPWPGTAGKRSLTPIGSIWESIERTTGIGDRISEKEALQVKA